MDREAIRREALEEAAELAASEPEFEGPMPWRNRLLAVLFPERSVRAACVTTKASIVRAIRKRAEDGALDRLAKETM